MKAIIKNIKYRLAADVWKEFCLVVKPEELQKLKIFKNLFDGKFYLTPLPLHSNKLRARGFNQAKIIALFFNQFLEYRIGEYLIRKKDTLSQAQLKHNKDRYINMRGAFDVVSSNVVLDKNFILVDDVVTTGSTLKEAARVLKSAGARRIFALTLAKG